MPLKRVIDSGWPSIEQTKQLESFSLIERCRQLAENFELKFDAPGEYDLTTIEQSLIQQNTVEISGAKVDDVEPLSSIEAPWRVSQNGSFALSGSELVGYPTGVA